MAYFKLAIILLILATVVYPLAIYLLQDWYVTQYYYISKENTKNKKILITGASQGIGEALAYEYAKFGAHVFVTGRNVERLTKVAKNCTKLGASKSYFQKADMSAESEAEKLIKKANKDMDGIDIVILNHVATYVFERSDKIVTTIKKSYTTNLLSYIEASIAARPILEKSHGSLVIVSSIAAKNPVPYCYDYCIAKRGLESFFASFRQELAFDNSTMHVGIAVLGLIDTKSARLAMPPVLNVKEEDIKYASVEQTAQHIATIPLAKVRELVTPWKNRWMYALNEFRPYGAETTWRKIMKKKT